MICNFLHNLTATNCRQFFLLLSETNSTRMQFHFKITLLGCEEKFQSFSLLLLLQKYFTRYNNLHLVVAFVARNNTICILNISANTCQARQKMHLKAKLNRHQQWSYNMAEINFKALKERLENCEIALHYDFRRKKKKISLICNQFGVGKWETFFIAQRKQLFYFGLFILFYISHLVQKNDREAKKLITFQEKSFRKIIFHYSFSLSGSAERKKETIGSRGEELHS